MKLLFSEDWLRNKLDEYDDIPACIHGVMAGICPFCVGLKIGDLNDDDSKSIDRGEQIMPSESD